MELKSDIDLYNYQRGAIDKIFQRFESCPSDYRLLYQLPTGGGKTIIFSEIVRQYLKLKKKRDKIQKELSHSWILWLEINLNLLLIRVIRVCISM